MTVSRSASAGRPDSDTSPFEETIEAVGNGERAGDVLLDHDHRHAALAHLGNDLVEFVDDARRETEADLVAEQQARIGEQRPAERDHLLLSAREFARMAAAPLLEHREPLVHLIVADLALAAELPADAQVFEHGKRRKELAALGDERDPLGDDVAGRERGKVVAVEARQAGHAAGLAHERLEEGRFARAVGPDDRDDLALADREVDIVHSLEGVVEDAEFFDGEERGGH